MSKPFNVYIEDPVMDYWMNLCVGRDELRSYARGDEFAVIGEVCRYIGYIRNGTFKYVAYSDGGDEHVVGLAMSGEFVADFPFSLYGQKSRVAIVADSMAEVWVYPVRELVAAMPGDKELERMVSRSCVPLFSQTYDRYLSLYCKTPAQRYDDLISRHPDLFSLFSLKDIASYLNITPTHLSRLRKNIE